MNSLSFLRQMLQDVRHQKVRTLLTLFGITWGTVSVALLVAFGEGLQRQDPEEPARARGEHRDRLARAHLAALGGTRQGPADPGLRGGPGGPAARDPGGPLLRRVRARPEHLPPRARPPHPRHVRHQPGVRRDAQPDPGERRALRERHRRRPPAARRLPGRQAEAGPLRRGRRGGPHGDDRQRPVPGRGRDGEEGAGLELQRPRPGQGLHPRHHLQGSLQRALRRRTSSSRPRARRWCRR